MMAFSHVLTGLSVYSMAVHYTDLPWGPATVGAVVAGSLLPDIDHPKSWLGRRLLPISVPLTMLVGHRGVTHSLLAVVAMAFVLTFYGSVAGGVVTALCIGYVVHLAGDFVTNSGIPLFWPIKRRYRLPLATTGGIVEPVIVLAVVAWAGVVQWGALRGIVGGFGV